MEGDFVEAADSIIQSGLRCIGREQARGGGFQHLSSSDPLGFSSYVSRETTFFASNILNCLNVIDKCFPGKFEELARIRAQAAHFLMGEKSARWSFNYWSRGAKEKGTFPYTDDLDDTFVGLTALYGYDRSIIGGEALANVATLLVETEIKAGGPYRTWLIGNLSNRAWRDVDVVVNANVGHFLALVGVEVPGVRHFLKESLARGKVASPYYPTEMHACYFLSRFMSGEAGAEEIAQRILFALDAEFGRGNPLVTAMAISSLVRLGKAAAIRANDFSQFIHTLQDQEEWWRPYPFCLDPKRDGKIFYAGSPALTAAFCAEALAEYLHAMEREERPQFSTNATVAKHGESALQKIKTAAFKRAELAPVAFRQSVCECIQQINDPEIVLLPYRFRASLVPDLKKLVSEPLIEKIALINLYGWAAYSIYDDILDGEDVSGLLLVANYCLAELGMLCGEMESYVPGATAVARRMLDIVNDGNFLEVRDSRVRIEKGVLVLPEAPLEMSKNKDLSRKSFGHALPALILLRAIGYREGDEESNEVSLFFSSYLAARQLHDDARDWKEDLLRGNITPICVSILKKWRSEHPQATRINLAKEISTLGRIFEECIPGIIASIERELKRARDCLEKLKLKIFSDKKQLEELVDGLQHALGKIRRDREENAIFLRMYRSAGGGT